MSSMSFFSAPNTYYPAQDNNCYRRPRPRYQPAFPRCGNGMFGGSISDCSPGGNNIENNYNIRNKGDILDAFNTWNMNTGDEASPFAPQTSYTTESHDDKGNTIYNTYNIVNNGTIKDSFNSINVNNSSKETSTDVKPKKRHSKHHGEDDHQKKRDDGEKEDPLVLDLNGDGIKTTKPGMNYDLDADGKVDKTSGFGSDDGVLAFDANGDGKIDPNGKELLGNRSDIDGDGKPDNYANGFEALKALAEKTLGKASTADGTLDSNEIRALQDKTGLSLMVGGQRKSLSDCGVNQFNLGYTESSETDQYGNEHRQQGSFQINGKTQNMTDVWLAKK